MATSTITTQRRKGEIIGYSVNLPRTTRGKRNRKFFKTLGEAEKVAASYTLDPSPTFGEVIQRHRNEILHCYDQLREVDSSFKEATQFFLKHGALKTKRTMAEVVDLLLTDKENKNKKPSYIENLSKTYTRFMNYVGRKTLISDITSADLDDYIYDHNHRLQDISKKNLIRNLSVLFKYAIRNRFLKLNPLEIIETPTLKHIEPKIISPTELWLLLDHCYTNQFYEELATFVLVSQCGIRIGEASALKWQHVDLDENHVKVPREVAKRFGHRINPIRDNASEWLGIVNTLMGAKPTTPIIRGNSDYKLRHAREKSGINYSQNCLRHSFCSYELKLRPEKEVLEMMGHSQSAETLVRFYRNTVSKADAELWANVYPDYDMDEDDPSIDWSTHPANF